MKDNINRKPEDLAYLAGYIDADGTIGLRHYKPRNEYIPVLSIVSCRRDILEDLQNIAAVGGYIWTGENAKGSGRLISRLQYSHRKACKVCEMAFPYLRLKGVQAALIVQIGAFRRRHHYKMDFCVDSYYAPRFEEMRRLNAANKAQKIR